MQLKYLQTFKSILDAGSFAAAARQLNYTQSTVTFQIQQLEQNLNVKLFEKAGRNMLLTEAGRQLLPYVDAVLQSVEQLENVGRSSDELRGNLTVAVPQSLLTYAMPPILQSFQKKAPGVRLSVRAMNCYAIREASFTGDFDLGIHYDVGGYGDSFVIEPLMTAPLALVASSSLPKEEQDFITPGQRKSVRLLTNDPESIYYRIFSNYLRERAIVPGGETELGSIETIRRCLVSNLGVAILPRFIVEEELARGELIELPVAIRESSVTAVCSYRKNRWRTPAMELFLRLLREHMGPAA